MCGQILILQHLHWTYLVTHQDLVTPPLPAQMNNDTSTCWLNECCAGLQRHCWNTGVQVVVCRLENGVAFTLVFTLSPPSEVVLQTTSLISTWILIINSVFHTTPSISHGDQQLVTNEQKKSRSTVQVFWSVLAPKFLRGQKKNQPRTKFRPSFQRWTSTEFFQKLLVKVPAVGKLTQHCLL